MAFWAGISRVFRRPVVNVQFSLEGMQETVLGQTPAQLYASQPHLRTVISFRARNVAQLGVQVFERVSDTDRRRVTDGPVAQLLKHPNDTMTGYEVFERLVSDLDLYDVAYWLVVPSVDAPSGWVLQPIPPVWVTSIKGDNIFSPETYVVEPGNGNRVEVAAADMLVFHGWNPENPAIGLSPVGALKDVLAEQIDAWRFRRQMWQKGGRVGTYLSRPKDAPKWNQEDRERFQRDWQQFQSTGAKAGSSPLLEDGMDMRRIGFSAREDEWSEVTKLSLQTVASVYHVNPVMVGILDNANFSNTREFRKMLYSETLGPLLQMVQDRLNAFLVPKIQPDGNLYVEFNIASKLAGDFEEQASVLSTLVGRPILTMNEGRAKLNYSGRDDGNTVITPLNVTEGGQASPQDGGKPAGVVDDVVKAWIARLDRSVGSKLDAGLPVDWVRWEKELCADLVVKAGVDQFNAGMTAHDVCDSAMKAKENKDVEN